MSEASPAKRVEDLLVTVAEALGLEPDVEVVEEPGHIRAILHGEEMGLFIGRHGQTIDAVQHLAYKAAAQSSTPPPKVEVDAAGYRERRRAALEGQADQAADDAVR
jgi:spoIIIJ-associated protein